MKRNNKPQNRAASALARARARKGNARSYNRQSAPIATSVAMRSNAPVIRETRGARVISHREFIASVAGSTGFAATPYALNPGVSQTFPWLSTQASGWEQYHFRKLVFHYLTRCATTKIGTVILAPEYDASDPAPLSEAQVTAYDGAIGGASWQDLACSLNVSAMFPVGPSKYIRDSRVPGDVKMFDSGTFYLCTTDQDNTDGIGKLWVEYEVELKVPQLNRASNACAATSVSIYAQGAQTFATGVAELAEWSTTVVDGLGLGNFAAGLLTLPKGAFHVSGQMIFSNTSNEEFAISALIEVNAAAVAYGGVLVTDLISAGGRICVPFNAYVTSDGNDTLALNCTLTGAAGTLTAFANTNLLVIRPI